MFDKHVIMIPIGVIAVQTSLLLAMLRRMFFEPSKYCAEIQNGRLKAPKYREETSKPEKPKEEDEEFRKLMEFIGEAMNETMKRNFSECPPFFTPFGDEDKCISLFHTDSGFMVRSSNVL
ncbi:hypothetical protein Avbf_17859 [Armadillidium vulgare]|nr:hypothetical protein Avbf_17859 [Armadillidium vulgare]